tara:strand:+ start:1784 stop:1984 length:201 start_codon:yes stop_codon:yes gene_type:complete
MIEELPIRNYSHTEAIAKLILAVNQVIKHLNQREESTEEGKEELCNKRRYNPKRCGRPKDHNLGRV